MELFETLHCHKILPLTYDNSLSYYETLCALRSYVNNLSAHINNLENGLLEKLVKQYIKQILIGATYDEENTRIILSYNQISTSGDHVYDGATGTMYVN